MFKRLLSPLFCLTILFLASCGGDTGQRGSLTVQADLRISDISVEGATPTFSPDNFGAYELSVVNAVESVDFTLGQLFADSNAEIIVFRSANRVGGVAVEPFQETVLPGTTVTVPIEQGLNAVTIRIRTDDREQFLDYRFAVRRTASNANLGSLEILDADDRVINSDVGLPRTSDFDPEVTNYTIEIPYAFCTTNLRADTAINTSELRLNGEIIRADSIQRLDLPVGASEHVITVESEDGTNTTTYNLMFNRAEPTQEELDEDFKLSNLGITQGNVRNSITGGGFSCDFLNYTALLDSNEAVATITATPVVADRQVQIGRQVTETADDGSEETSIIDLTLVPAGDTVDFDLEVGANTFVVSTRNDDSGEAQFDYRLIVTRSDGSRTIVSTGAELQQALQSALPSDEIFIANTGGEPLSANSLVAESGKEGSIFYSAASGTAEEPITLINASSSVLSPLAGNDDVVVFELSGDHWQILNIDIEGGSTGILFNDASHNVVVGARVTGTSSAAVQLLNGSDENAFTRLAISDSGDRGLVVGSDAASWVSAPVAGPYEAVNLNNHFGKLFLDRAISGAHIHVEEGADGTIFRSIQVDASEVNDATAALIEVQGNNTEFSFSEVSVQGGNSITSIFSISDAGAEWLTEEWGEGTQITDMSFDLPGLESVFVVSATESVDNVLVANNEREDGIAVRYSGAGIDQNFVRPAYQIQWVDWANVDEAETNIAENTYCLSRASIEVSLALLTTSVVNTAVGIVPALCDASDADQHWDITHDGDGFVTLTDSSSDTIAGPAYQATVVNSRVDGVLMFNSDVVGDTGAFFLRWAFSAEERGGFGFMSKLDSSLVLAFDSLDAVIYQINGETGLPTQAGSFIAEDEDSLVMSVQARSSETQPSFTLLPLP